MNIEDYVTAIGGIAEYRQLDAAGFSARAARRAIYTGRLSRLRRGWVASGSASPDARRAVRVGGSLTCVSRLRMLGVWSIDDPLLHVRVGRHAGHISTPHDRTVALSDAGADANAVRLHRTFPSMHAPRETHSDPVEVALAHAIGCQTRDYAVALCDSAVNLKLTTRTRIARSSEPISAHHREVVRLIDGSAQSGLETKARLRLFGLRIPYRTQAPISTVGRVDLLIGDRFVLELDGSKWHSGPEAFAEDRRRDLILHERGYLVLRLTYSQTMFEWPRVEALIRRVVARQQHRWPRGTSGGGAVVRLQ